MNRIDDVFKPFEALTSGTGKIFKTKVDGTEKFVRSTGIFSRIRHFWSERASEKDLKSLYDKVKNLRGLSGVDSKKVEETFAKTLSLISSDSSLKETAQKIREEETRSLEEELGELKKSQAFSNDDIAAVLRARSWLESLKEPTELEDKLRNLVDEIGLQISRQFTKASQKAEKEFQKNATPEKAKELLRDPLIGKVAKWQEPFSATIFKVIEAVAKSKATPIPPKAKPTPPPRPWRPHKPSEPTGPKPKASVLSRWQHNISKAAEPPKRKAVTPPPTLKDKSKTAPPHRSISNPRMSLNLDALPKAPQPRVLEAAPKHTAGPCPAKHQSKADALHKNSVFKGKPTLKKEHASQLTKYLEENKSALVKLAKESPNQSVFVARQITGLPRSIQISIEEGEPKFYILLKSGISGRKDKIGILGKGGEKTVKLALEYSQNSNAHRMVASASIGSQVGGSTVNNALEEYVSSKEFGGALSLCRYVNSKGKDVANIIMPLASHGEINSTNFNELKPVERKNFVLSAAGILRQMHRAGFVSNDIKPENILLNVDSNGKASALITDHGSTVKAGSKIKHCSPNIRSLELNRGKGPISHQDSDPSQDIWAFGITLWKLTHEGKQPKWRPDGEFKYEARWENAATSTPIEELCKAMLHPDPKQRPDIDSVVEELAKQEFKHE